jgi:hypothetical protein
MRRSNWRDATTIGDPVIGDPVIGAPVRRRQSTWTRALRLWLRQTVPPPWAELLDDPQAFAALVTQVEQAGFRRGSHSGPTRLRVTVRTLLEEQPS